MKKILTVVVLLMVLVIVIYGSVYAYFYFRGKMLAFQMPYTSWVFTLGKIPQSSYPKSLDTSFKKFVTKDGQLFRQPLYVDDMIVESEDNGELWARDMRTGEKKLYHWTEDVAYVCVDPRIIQVGSESIIQPNPKDAIANYYFVLPEYGIRGDQHRQGFYHFETDVKPGLPVKLILKNRVPEFDGGYNLVGIFLFTDNSNCAIDSV